MSPSDVTVIITTYKREKWVLDAVASARSQRGVRADVIVVDDSPSGSAREAVASLADAGVRYVHRDSPSGGRPGLVRNDAIALARTPLVHFLDDDNRLADGALAALADELWSSRAGMAFGRVLPFGQEPTVSHETEYFARVARAARRIRGRRWFAAQLLFLDSLLVNSACMVRRDVFEAVGGYDVSLHCCEDVDLCVRIGRTYGARFVDRDVLHYRVGAPSIMKEVRETDQHPGLLDAYRTMNGRYRARHGTLEYRSLQMIAKTARRLAIA